MVLIRRLLAVATAGTLALAATALLTASAVTAFAQEVVQDEGTAYRAWYEAYQAKDIPKAIQAAKDYLEKYPTGQYADKLKQFLVPAEYEQAIKEKRIDDALKAGRQLLTTDPQNVMVMYQLAFSIWTTELIASPPKFDHLADAVELVRKAIPLIEGGKAPAGVEKNVALAWMTNVLAINATKSGNVDEAVNLYGKSTSLAPGNVPLVTRNLYAVFTFRHAGYSDAVKAFKSLPEDDQKAPESKPEAKSVLDHVNTQADALIDSAAAFVAFTKSKGVAVPAREKVNQELETVYKSRHPDDAPMAGLQKILQEKETALGGAPAAPGA